MRRRVLVIDDEQLVLTAIRRILSPEYEVVPMSRPQDAIDAIRGGERYDAVLCDLMMPELTGMDVHEELTRIEPELAERMIFLSGGAFAPRAQAFLLRVPNRRVDKPFQIEDLRAAIEAVVSSPRA